MKRRWISLLLTGTLVLGSLAMSGCGYVFLVDCHHRRGRYLLR